MTISIKDDEIIKIEEGNREDFHYGISFDIGTTSVYGGLLDLKNKKTLSTVSSYNGQIRYGDDVITRIIYANKGGLHILQKSIFGTMEEIIDELLKETKLKRSDISYIVCSGNTTMIHLLLGIPPRYIREEPYTPAITSKFSIPASTLGLKFDPSVILYTLPCVSSYIGSDITAGVTACGMRESKEITLYVDLGTNGEIVLGNCDFLLSCSTSAGPCFEGGGIKCGVRAQVGAIDGVEIDKDGNPSLMVIGGGKPAGICGAGLIDLVSWLWKAGIISQKGKFEKNIKNPRIREKKYILVWADESQTNSDIVITEGDLDNIIRTKAAIFAGISVLLKTVGITYKDIERIVIAGNLGSHIRPNEAIEIGLFPNIELDKFHFFGNGSFIGATISCFSKEMFLETEKTASSMTNIELSSDKSFMDEFIASMFIPHTNYQWKV
ncbi:TPA: hypothetical protein DCX16_04550 [bacterium]|nr:hypothetical protein [bacterium]